MVPDMNPPAAAPDFLVAAGWGGAEIRPLAGDASFRRYFRVVEHDRPAILMDAPPPHEDPRPFINVARWLTAHGFAAPEILHEDLGEGLVLIQDFGDARMRETVDAAPESELRLYEEAIDLLIRLAGHPAAADLRPYSHAEYRREVALLPEWYCPAVGLDVDGEGYARAWDEVLAPVLAGHTPVTVLRDYHVENIMLIDGSAETLG
ncbi:aminoglycoside phosphotransferase, partial [Staphylococcus aureus]